MHSSIHGLKVSVHDSSQLASKPTLCHIKDNVQLDENNIVMSCLINQDTFSMAGDMYDMESFQHSDL